MANLASIQRRIVKNLSPDLIQKGLTYDPSNPTYGFCYVASECLYHLYGKENGYFPVQARDYKGLSHWWLQNSRGKILDPTADQYKRVGEKPPYGSGKRIQFLTVEPSKRCVKLINRTNGQ